MAEVAIVIGNGFDMENAMMERLLSKDGLYKLMICN